MISFIIPSFNQGNFIKESIDSILFLMEKDDQLIIQDGGSTDHTAQIVSDYLLDKRIEWYCEKDSGFSEAIERALSRAKHMIIGIQSSDDAYCKLSDLRLTVLKSLSSSDVVGVYANYEHIAEDGKHLGVWMHRNGSLNDFMTLRVILPQSSFFFKKSALKGKSILNIKYDYVADVVLFNQISQAGKVLYINEIWSKVRIQPGCRTGKKNPGHQYLLALNDGVFGQLTQDLLRSSIAAAYILSARYEASSGYRFLALHSVLKALSLDLSIISHKILFKSMNYILIGPSGVEFFKKIIGNLLEIFKKRIFQN